jgi:predicted RNase H-like HicB family nuclease
MKYRAVIKKSGEWWIGRLIDLPGVNAQEKTKAEFIESLRVGAEDMLERACTCWLPSSKARKRFRLPWR